MENVNKPEGEEKFGGVWGSRMGMCGCHGGGRNHLVKMILKMLIVIIIFWAGYRLGEITGYIKSEYGGTSGMMRQERGFGMMNNGFGGYQNIAPQNTTTTPAVPAQ